MATVLSTTASTHSASPPRPRSGETASTASDKSLRDDHRTPASTSTHTVNSSVHSKPASHSIHHSKTNSRSQRQRAVVDSDTDSELDQDMNRPAIFNVVDRGAPGDGALIAMTKRNPENVKVQKQRNQFYSEVFAYREMHASPRERAGKDSVVYAHVKTNVIISDEYSFMTDLSSFLAQRYSRPESSIMVTLNHSACMLFGGSFEPTYHLTISALSPQVQSTVNKRNAALIQAHFEEELHVSPNRGVIRFEAVPEEGLATGGMTVTGEIESLTKNGGSTAKHHREGSGGSNKIKTNKKPGSIPAALKSISREQLKVFGKEDSPTKPQFKSAEEDDVVSPLPTPTHRTAEDIKVDQMGKMGKRKKSIRQMFGR